MRRIVYKTKSVWVFLIFLLVGGTSFYASAVEPPPGTGESPPPITGSIMITSDGEGGIDIDWLVRCGGKPISSNDPGQNQLNKPIPYTLTPDPQGLSIVGTNGEVLLGKNIVHDDIDGCDTPLQLGHVIVSVMGYKEDSASIPPVATMGIRAVPVIGN